MKNWLVYSLLFITIILASWLNFMPHANYSYPLHVDEWVHFQYANHISSGAPMYFNGNEITLEQGFHILLATLNAIGIPYLILFKFFPILITALILLSVFILTRKIFCEKVALFSALFAALLQSTVSILGPMFLVPLSLGLFLIAIGLYLLETNSNLFFLPLATLLIIHPPSAIAYFIIINIRLILNRKKVIKHIGYQMLAFIIALPLYIPIFMQKGINTINNLAFEKIISPVFIPQFIGYFSTLIIGIGIYFFIIRKRYDFVIYTLSLLFLIILFYRFDLEVLVPYARTLMYLFLVFAVIFGCGCFEVTSIFKNKKANLIILIILIALIISFGLPAKIESTKYVYHIIENNDYNAFEYIKANTPPDAIVLIDPWKANALTPIAERQVYSRIMQGPNAFYEARNNQIKGFFDNGCQDLGLLKQDNISVVYGNCSNIKLKEIYSNVYMLQD